MFCVTGDSLFTSGDFRPLRHQTRDTAIDQESVHPSLWGVNPLVEGVVLHKWGCPFGRPTDP